MVLSWRHFGGFAMNRWIILFVVNTVSIAHAEDIDSNGCDDAYEVNSSCVSESASVDASTTVGASQLVVRRVLAIAPIVLDAYRTNGHRPARTRRPDRSSSGGAEEPALVSGIAPPADGAAPRMPHHIMHRVARRRTRARLPPPTDPPLAAPSPHHLCAAP